MTDLCKEILEKREELEILEKQYEKETPKCTNDNCTWFKPSGFSNNPCHWTVLVETCKDYKTD